MAYLKCNKGDYQSGTEKGRNCIDDPYGIPEHLIPKVIGWHEEAHKGHKVMIVTN